MMKVRFCSPVRSALGYAEFGRIIINQLVQSGCDVSVVEIPVSVNDGDFGPLGRQALQLANKPATGVEVNIVNMIPSMFAKYRLAGARNIGLTMFEADSIPSDWVESCNAMDALWVPSAWVRDVFMASGVRVPVSVVGVEADPAITVQPAPAAGPFRLLSIFQWSARKNPIGLLRAYCAAFDGRDDTVLTLKAYRHTDAASNAAFVQNAVNYTLSRMRPRASMPRVEIATEFLPAEQMDRLHTGSHAYVSLSHAEGWGLPAWESTLRGKPVIHTGWSAPLEFIHPQGALKCNLAPVYGMEEFVRFYDTSMNWAEPHLDDAIDKLRNLHSDYGAWCDRAVTHAGEMQQRYSLQNRLEQVMLGLKLP